MASLLGKLAFLALTVTVTAPAADKLHDDAERDFTPWYQSLARGQVGTWTQRMRHPWPVALKSIGHTMSSYQKYGLSPYFHHGIDIRADAGSDVVASAGGKVVNIENYMPPHDAYWEVAIQDRLGFIWQYHHVDRDSIPQKIWDAWRNGGSVPPGEKLGEVYYWSEVTFGERFHHIHLNVLGAGGAFQNPFLFLEALDDQSPPEIRELGILRYGQKWQGAVEGTYSLYGEFADLILHDQFIVPPYHIEFRVDGGPAHTVWRFNTLPGKNDVGAMVERFFVPQATCGNYQCRKLTVDLGFSTAAPFAFPRDPGPHSIEVRVQDFVGNEATETFHWNVRR